MSFASVPGRDSRSGSRLPCEDHATRLSQLDALVREQASRHNAQLVVVHGSISRLELKMDRLLEGIQIGAVVSKLAPPVPTRQRVQSLQSLDWAPDEQTNPGAEGAKVWKERANKAAIAMVREKTKAKKAIIAAIASAIVTVITAAAAILPQLLSK